MSIINTQVLGTSDSEYLYIDVYLYVYMFYIYIKYCRRPWFYSWVGKSFWRRDRLSTAVFMDFPGSSDGKESTCNVGDLGLIPGLGRSLGGGHGNSPVFLPGESPWTEELGEL